MHPLLLKQDNLHNEATRLLEEIVLPLLKEYGDVKIGGSYAYNLLSYPDIDLDLINSNLTKDMYSDLCAKLISHKNVSKFKTADRVDYSHKNTEERPVGYWISPEIQFGGNVWGLDIWFQKPEWNTGDTNKYSERLATLSEEDRILVLSMKEELLAKGIYGIGKEFQSVDVYEAVLGGAKSVSELRDHKLQSQ